MGLLLSQEQGEGPEETQVGGGVARFASSRGRSGFRGPRGARVETGGARTGRGQVGVREGPGVGGIVGAGGRKSRDGPWALGPGVRDRARERAQLRRGSGEVTVSWEGGLVAGWAWGPPVKGCLVLVTRDGRGPVGTEGHPQGWPEGWPGSRAQEPRPPKGKTLWKCVQTAGD